MRAAAAASPARVFRGKTKIIDEWEINNCLPRSPLAVLTGAEAVARQDGQKWSRTGFADCSTVYRLISERGGKGERRTPHADQHAP